MILDAILKTKSRTVLMDIINKNGNKLVLTMHWPFLFSNILIVESIFVFAC